MNAGGDGKRAPPRGGATSAATAGGWQVRRLGSRPVLGSARGARPRANLNGPSLLRMPPWATGALGRLHLYYADHRGHHLRLAWADDVRGPWRVHPPGCLGLAQSRFCTEPADPPCPPPYWQGAGDGWRQWLYPHVASPDVHVDEGSREIRLYFHGLLPDGDQRTRLAVSRDGVSFRVLEPLVAPAYLRAFRHDGVWYGLSAGNRLLRSPDGRQPFEQGPAVLPARARHAGVLVEGDRVHVLWTEIGAAPERIERGVMRARGDWRRWRLQRHGELMRPLLPWEGAGRPVRASRAGAADVRLNELRDPFLFRDRGRLYLCYAGGGESGLGLAEVLGGHRRRYTTTGRARPAHFTRGDER